MGTAQALTLNASRPETKVLSVRLWLLHASSSPAYLIRRLTLTLALSSLSLIQFIQSSPPLAERGPGRQSTSRPVSMAGPASPDAGPDDSQVPLLPTGWIAQWDSSLRKYYYVQISTGQSTWDKPTEAAPGAPRASAASTPAQGNPTQPPPFDRTMSGDGQLPQDGARGFGDQHGPSPDRAGGFGGMAMNAILGGNKQSSGHGSGSGGLVGQLASGLLGGGKQSHGSSGGHGNGGAGGLVGQLA